jgi:RNA polymerase sigma-70 factor (ECF subfamily)
MPDGRRWIVEALDRHERALCGYAHRLTGDPELARDIVQDCFLRLCREPRTRVDGRVAEWLFTVCRNRAFDHLRKRGRMEMSTAPDLQLQESRGTLPADAAAHTEEAARLLAVLRELPERQQEIVRLKFQEGLSYKQIAAFADLSVSHVGVLLHTAMRTLRARLGATNPRRQA